MTKAVQPRHKCTTKPSESALTPPVLDLGTSEKGAGADSRAAEHHSVPEGGSTHQSRPEQLHVEYRAVERLVPYARNARTHSEAQVAQIAGSIREFGWTNPVLVDGEGGLIAGHARVLAARQLGLTRVPVIEIKHLSEAQKRAYILADNQLALNAGWDMDLLRIELDELKELGSDLGLIGFSEDELSEIFADPSLPEIADDAIPAPPDEAVTQKGDLWVLGNHRLLCGDSASPHDVDKLVDGKVIHLVNTDPPYNVKVEPRSNNAIAAGASSFGYLNHHQASDLARQPGKSKPTDRKMRPKDRPLANDFVSEDAFAQLLDAWFGNLARVLMAGGAFYIWGGYSNYDNYPPVLKRHGLYFSQGIIWVKEHPILTRKDFMGNHECAFYGWKEGAGHKFYGPANVPDVWSVKKVSPQQMVHLTEKPIELAVRALSYSSREGQNVLDLFGGSGSTLMAAEQMKRKAFLMEIDPLYCDVIVQRWENLTRRKGQRVAGEAHA